MDKIRGGSMSTDELLKNRANFEEKIRRAKVKKSFFKIKINKRKIEVKINLNNSMTKQINHSILMIISLKYITFIISFKKNHLKDI